MVVFLLAGLKPLMFALSVTCNDIWINHFAFGLLMHDLGFFDIRKSLLLFILLQYPLVHVFIITISLSNIGYYTDVQ